MNKILVALLCTILTCCDSCIHMTVRPLAFHSFGVVCEGHRDVVCDATLSPAECAVVQTVVAEFNDAVPGLLTFKGTIPHAQAADAPDEGYIVVLPSVPRLIPTADIPIAVTRTGRHSNDMCLLGGAHMVLIAPSDRYNTDDWAEIVAHEMMHALGFEHTEQDTPLSTVMRPAALVEKRKGLSDNDKLVLTTVYSRAWF